MNHFTPFLNKRCASILLLLVLLTVSWSGYAATITSKQDGLWSSTSTWYGDVVPGASDDVVIDHVVEIPSSYKAETNNITISKTGDLIVSGGLVVYGNFSMQFNGQDYATLRMNDEAYVVVNGNVVLTNKVTLSIASYFIVKGNINGAAGNTDFTIEEDAQVYLLGDVDHNLNLESNCDEGYEYTDYSEADCDYGGLEDFIDNYDGFPDELKDALGCVTASIPGWNSNGEPQATNSLVSPGSGINLRAQGVPPSSLYLPVVYVWSGPNNYSFSETRNDWNESTVSLSNATTNMTGYYVCRYVNAKGCFIEDSTYVHVGDCGDSDSRFFSIENQTGNWEDASSWGRSSASYSIPPSTNTQSGITTIYGTIYRNGDLTTTSSGFQICDTLIVYGDMVANSITISPSGVLIVMGNLSVSGGFSNEGSIIVDETLNSGWISSDGPIYIFDHDPIKTNLQPGPDGTSPNDISNNTLKDLYCSLDGADCSTTVELIAPEFKDGNNVVECLPSFDSFADFATAEIEYTDIFTAGGYIGGSYVSITAFSYEKSYTYPPGGGCPSVEVIYKATIDGVDITSDPQIFQLNDSDPPVVNGGNPLPDITLYADASCLADFTVNFDYSKVTDGNCSVILENANFRYYPGNDNAGTMVSDAGDVADQFPVGITTIYWSVTDECGNESDEVTQDVVVSSSIPIDPITYDSNSTDKGVASGKQPIYSSTHNYAVDAGEASPDNYTYTWDLLNASGNFLSTITSGVGLTATAITFTTGYTEGTTYQIQVTKTNSSGCSIASRPLDISVLQNDFDISVEDLGNTCQDGVSGSTTRITWRIGFGTTDSQPFDVTYTLDRGAVACTGTLTGITFDDNVGTVDLAHTETGGCAVTYGYDSAHTLYLMYAFTSDSENDQTVALTINSASGEYSVSESGTETVDNNSDGAIFYGVPDTSDIQPN